MMNFLTLKALFAVVLSIMLYAATGIAGDICGDQKQKSAAAQMSGVAFDKFDWARLDKSVLIIGDNHAYTVPDDIYALEKAFVQTKKGKNCLFLEFSNAMDIENFKQKISGVFNDPDLKALSLYYRQIVEQAESLGIQVHLVDHPDTLTKEMPISIRNKAMAANIKALFDNSTCTSGVQIVGEAHVAPDDASFSSIREDLNNSGLTNAALNLVYISKQPPANLNKWISACENKPFIPKYRIIFSDSSIKNLPIWPLYSQSAVYGYFDYSILIP